MRLLSSCFLAFFFIIGCLSHQKAVAGALGENLPPRTSGKIYLAETSGNWGYLPKMNKSGDKNIICLAFASQPPYAVTLRAIPDEFGLSITNKAFHLSLGKAYPLLLKTKGFLLKKEAYPSDEWTLSATFSESEKDMLFRHFSRNRKVSFSLPPMAHFDLSLKGSAKILSLFQDCQKNTL